MKTFGQVVLGIIVVVVVFVGGWFGYWALAEKSTTNNYIVNTHNQQYQASLVSQERDRITGYDVAMDPAQKAQIKATFCQIYPDLDPAPADLVQANALICS